MTIITNNFYVSGTMCNIPINASTLTAPGFSNCRIESDMQVKGNIFSSSRLDTGATMFSTFRPISNMSFSNGVSELYGGSFQYDWTAADMSAMTMPLAVARSNILNTSSGVITVPVSGFYNLEMQGSFSNDANATNALNGVFYRFLNQSYSNARRAAVVTRGPVVSTSTSQYLLAGDRIQPSFYSSDSNARLLANGETYVGFSVMCTVTPTHSNYFRV
jgi:hypothetical protein